MFCPSCRDEFRPGFTRCTVCDVDLVESLAAEAPVASRRPAEGSPAAARPLIDYCGFVSLDEAREARERLRSEGIRVEIVIRDGPAAPREEAHAEEYWLRVDRARVHEVDALLDYDESAEEAQESEDESFQCGACGAEVGAEDSSCPRCGASFEEA